VSALTDICREAYIKCEVYRAGISTERAVEMALPRVMDDPEALRHAARIGVDRTVTQMATKERRKDKDADSGQFEMFEEFGLRQRYAVDSDERKLKYTGWLTLMEFLRIIEMRRNQLIADQNHLTALEKTYDRLRPFWDANPHLMFDEVALLYRDAA
jgi:hypothetical protein